MAGHCSRCRWSGSWAGSPRIFRAGAGRSSATMSATWSCWPPFRGEWMLRGTLLILLAMIPAAHGQSINKCKHPRTGAVAYSSSPCPSTEAEWKAEFEGTGDARDRDRMTASQARASVAADQRYLDRSRQAERSAYSGSRGYSVPSTIGQCEAAKRTRDANLQASRPRQGHSIEALRSWDAYVNAACK